MKNIIDLFIGGNNWIWNGALIVLGIGASLFCYSKYKKTHSRPLLNCLPGIFTSLGLLGTFCAIGLSLHSIGGEGIGQADHTGMSLAEVKAMEGNGIDIKVIIQNLIPAFTTSILGLIFAIVATIWVRCIFAEEDAKEDDKLKNKTPEEYIRELVENTDQQIQLQKEQIQKSKEYNDKLNDNIGNQSKILKDFIDGFVKRMDEIFTRMQDNIQQQVQNFGEEQFTKATNLLVAIAERTEETTEKIIHNQNQSVETILGQTNTKIVDINSAITGTLENLTKEIKHSLEELGSNQSERLNSIVTNYDTFANNLSEQLQQKFYDVLTNTLSMNERVSNNLKDSMENLTKEITHSLEELGSNQSERLNSIVTNYDTFANNLSEQLQQKYSDMLTNTLSMNERVSNNLKDSMENLTKEITHSLEELGSNQSERLNSIVTNYDTFANNLSEQLQQKYSDMLTNTLSMNEHISNNLKDSMEKVVTNISEQCNALKSAIVSNVESLHVAYKFVESLIAEIRQNYEQAVLSYSDAVNVAHRTNEATEKSITAMNEGLADVKETNEKIAEVIDILTNRQESIEQLVKQINAVSATIVELRRLESTLNKIARS